jgi:hypothetical protein
LFDGPEWFWPRVVAAVAIVVWGIRRYRWARRRIISVRFKELADALHGTAKEGMFALRISAVYEGRALRLRLPMPWDWYSRRDIVIEFGVSAHLRGKIRPTHALDDVRRMHPNGSPGMDAESIDWFVGAGMGPLVFRGGKARVAYHWDWRDDGVQREALKLELILLSSLIDSVDPGGPIGRATT